MKGVFVRSGGVFVPADPSGQEALDTTPDGRRVVLDVRRARNPGQLSLFWVLCGLIADNTDFGTKDDVANILKLECGCFQPVRLPDDEETGAARWRKVPKSIAFESMDQTAFNEFFQRCLDYVVVRILPGMKANELAAEVWNICNGGSAA